MGPGPSNILLIGVIAVQIAGFGLLWTRVGDPGDQPVVASGDPPRPVIDVGSVVGATRFPDEELLRESVRAVIKQELDAYLAGREQSQDRAVAAAGASKRPAASPARTAAQRPDRPRDPQAVEASRAIVDRALAAGIWTDADSSALLAYKFQLNEAERVELLEKIFGAINSQRLKPVGSLPSL
jgi:hypothetical protein